MKSASIIRYLEGKTILVTGGTGFLGMVFLEKILRVQPDVKKIYLLLRASDTNSATKRMNNEIIGKDLFRVLREIRGAGFDSFISEKVVALAGDVTSENLGLRDMKQREEMCEDIQIIFNCAATTNFDERYDIALDVNTFGVLHAMSFAKKCVKLEMFLHVSTAYVCGERSGLLLEDSSSMVEMEKEMSKFDFEAVERNLVKEKLNELKAQGASPEIITNTMKNFGIERANVYGWPNTYVFTKAMGEIFLGRVKENLPVVTVRPTVVISTYKEPFRGWIQGFRTIDSVIASYCKGKLPCLLVDPTLVFDMVPVDMLVNSIIAAIAVNAINKTCGIIYHVGTSQRNPIKFCDIHDIVVRYCKENPWINKDGTIVKAGKCILFKNMASFSMYMQIRFMLPLQGLRFVNNAFGHYFQDLYMNYDRKLRLVMRLVELYKPYMLFKGIFDDANTEELQRITKESFKDAEKFEFDPKCIDWEDYIANTHVPGLRKHVMIKR